MTRVYNIKRTVAAASTGRQNSPHVPLGNGAWEILAASVSVAHTSGPEFWQKCHITYREERGDGALISQNLDSGSVGPDAPFCLKHNPIVRGPGEIFSVVNQIDSHIHEFQVTFRRIIELPA